MRGIVHRRPSRMLRHSCTGSQRCSSISSSRCELGECLQCRDSKSHYSGPFGVSAFARESACPICVRPCICSSTEAFLPARCQLLRGGYFLLATFLIAFP
eukprot:6174832-Pleurochrysis_carterae.AAC.2